MTRKRSEGDRQRAMRQCPVHVHVCDVGPSDEPPTQTMDYVTQGQDIEICACGEARRDGAYFVRDLPTPADAPVTP